MSDLLFSELREVNVARCRHWHPDGLGEWSALEWAGAMCGEAGEAANVAKKIKRVEINIRRRATGNDLGDLKQKLADEIADTLIYLDLLAAASGINLAEAVASKFNRTSAESGFAERLVIDYPF